jgi:penicillin-insensitive murein endopeptidase
VRRPLGALIIVIILSTLAASAYASDSTCFGTPSKGKLQGGVSLPESGTNFQSYSWLGYLLHRTYVHSAVKHIIVDAYKELERQLADKKFVYGESGWPSGGSFKPHKTHQNGLAVDFMVPVVNKSGDSIPLPTGIFNKFGYGIEFDNKGKRRDYRIDYEAMAAHLKILNQQAIKKGYGIKLVIFDPKLQKYLFKTHFGGYLKKHMHFTTKRAWVRHDEHYHIVFDVPCKPM